MATAARDILAGHVMLSMLAPVLVPLPIPKASQVKRDLRDCPEVSSGLPMLSPGLEDLDNVLCACVDMGAFSCPHELLWTLLISL